MSKTPKVAPKDSEPPVVPNAPNPQPPALETSCPYPTGSLNFSLRSKVVEGPDRNAQLPMPHAEPPQMSVPVAGQAFQTRL